MAPATEFIHLMPDFCIFSVLTKDSKNRRKITECIVKIQKLMSASIAPAVDLNSNSPTVTILIN